MFDLTDKTALITGATGGIGMAIAKEMKERGAKLILSGTKKDILDKLVANLGKDVKGIIADIGDKDSIASMAKEAENYFGSVDILVNNAGITIDGLLMRMKDEDWDNVIAVNLSSVFYCLKYQLKILLDQGGGNIVNVASLAGKKGVPLGCHYSASKHGVIGLTKTAAVEYGSRNIRVNAICPSFIETDIIEAVPKPLLEFVANFRVPLKRLGRPEEVANAIKFMLSDDASYMNGHSLVLDGGMDAG